MHISLIIRGFHNYIGPTYCEKNYTYVDEHNTFFNMISKKKRNSSIVIHIKVCYKH